MQVTNIIFIAIRLINPITQASRAALETYRTCRKRTNDSDTGLRNADPSRDIDLTEMGIARVSKRGLGGEC